MRPVSQRNTSSRKVGRYLVCGELASGGMATVHLGRLLGPVGFSKTVAIKRLHEHFALEQDFVTMFIDEARLAGSINHPNVISSLDVVAEGNELLLVMEYVQGETLSQLLRLSRQQAAFPPPRVIVRVVSDALEGLHAAHTASAGGKPLDIVHRDVSPQNIMVGVDGRARVLDFGIAKAASRSQTTRPGQVKGKFAYMSPEQVRGQGVDARTDVFAAGVVLWEALTRSRLFYSDDVKKTVQRLLKEEVVPPSHHMPGITPELDAVVMKAIARDPSARYQSAQEFAVALRGAAEEASHAEVGQWVSNVASEVLAGRLELLAELETSTVVPRSIPATRATPLRLPADLAARASSPSVDVPPPASAVQAAATVRPGKRQQPPPPLESGVASLVPEPLPSPPAESTVTAAARAGWEAVLDAAARITGKPEARRFVAPAALAIALAALSIYFAAR